MTLPRRRVGVALIALGAVCLALLSWRAARSNHAHAAYESAPQCDERRAVLADSSDCRLVLRADVASVDCLLAGESASVCDVTVRIATLDDEVTRSLRLRRAYASLLRAGGYTRVELFHGEVVRAEVAGAMVSREEGDPGARAWERYAWLGAIVLIAAGAWRIVQARRRAGVGVAR